MSTQLFSLEGRTALITGSARGLGYGIARGLAQAGARVVLNGTKPDTTEEARRRLEGEGLRAHALPFDVTDDAAVAKAFVALDEEGIEVDILVNNAGIQFRKPMVDLDPADWRRVLEVDLTSAFLVSQQAARRMIARGRGGKIINIASLMSQAARATVAPYTAAKGGLKTLTHSMVAEWAQFNIQANAIGPGYMATDMNEALMNDPAFDTWVKGRTPAKRWGQPDELVGAAVFLAAPASNYVNGQLIYVDGGMLAVL
ncbi:gluconate 5-dehydrogenase [Ancylobacter aquaticus]|uniref:Gluconate 5-dehydrogenase n=1 Tax=Ancylobacter aquaticus TaxID=100 RepID=A0A4V2PGF5_ANCAQ|nr:SDR family oxidoreductase [Ancylobacter aquaticus]TCK16606.1 gluconate 5-dehydrogenase [Ancylobacter aquaticus]